MLRNLIAHYHETEFRFDKSQHSSTAFVQHILGVGQGRIVSIYGRTGLPVAKCQSSYWTAKTFRFQLTVCLLK